MLLLNNEIVFRVTPRFGTPIGGLLNHYGTDLAKQLRLATGLNTATGNLTAPLIEVAIDKRPSVPSLVSNNCVKQLKAL